MGLVKALWNREVSTMTKIFGRPFDLVLLVAFTFPVPVVLAEDKPIPRWEYRVVTKDQVVELGKNDLAAGLNKLGNEGWELVVVDGGYIFKRSKVQYDKEIADLKLRIAILNRDIEMQKDRVAWSSRMLKMGYVSPPAVVAEKERLERYELILEKLNKDLDRMSAPPIEPIPLAPQPKERKTEK